MIKTNIDNIEKPVLPLIVFSILKSRHLDIQLQSVQLPGFVDTDMAKGEGQFWVASVDKASRQILNAIKNKRKIVYITKRWRLIAVLLKLLPRQIYDRM